MEESKVRKDVNDCEKSPVQKGDYVVKEIKILSTDTMKEIYFKGDTTAKGYNVQDKVNKKLKLKAVRTMYSCRKCDYRTTNRESLPLHKCTKNDQNNDTNNTQNVNSLINCNIQNTNDNMQNTSHIIQIPNHSNLTTNSAIPVNATKNVIMTNIQNTNYVIQIPNQNNLISNSAIAANINNPIINTNMQNPNYLILIPNHNDNTTNSTMTGNTNKNTSNSNIQNTNANIRIASVDDKKLSRKNMIDMFKQELIKEMLNNLSETDKIDAFNCTICRYACKTLKALNLHMDTHYYSENNLKCTKCSFIGKNMVDLKRHYDEGFNYKCHCGYDIHKKHDKIPHKNIHNVTMIALPEFFE